MRLASDLLMVNPNRGFTWHQDNQNGPVAFDDALRWWVTMDDTPPDYGESRAARARTPLWPALGLFDPPLLSQRPTP